MSRSVSVWNQKFSNLGVLPSLEFSDSVNDLKHYNTCRKQINMVENEEEIGL